MDSLHLTIALGPLSIYLLLIGMINLSRRPFVTTGARDLAALGVGISGFIMAGPMELFLPETAAWQFGGFVWVLLLALYTLLLTLLVLLMRPRIVVYNVTAEQLRPILANMVAELDVDARWAGESLVLPKLGVQLHVEPFGPLKNAQLISSGPRQSFAGWRRLELALAGQLRNSSASRNSYGFVLAGFSIFVICLITYYMVSDTKSVAHGLREMLRM